MKKVMFIAFSGTPTSLSKKVRKLSDRLKEKDLPIQITVFDSDTVDEEKNSLFDHVNENQPDAVVFDCIDFKTFSEWYDDVRDALGMSDLCRNNLFSFGEVSEEYCVTKLEKLPDVIRLFTNAA